MPPIVKKPFAFTKIDGTPGIDEYKQNIETEFLTVDVCIVMMDKPHPACPAGCSNL